MDMINYKNRLNETTITIARTKGVYKM